MVQKDDISQLYVLPKRLSLTEKILFIIDFVAAVASLMVSRYSDILVGIQIIITILYFICCVVDDGCFWYKAESARRRNSIEDGFNVSLSEYETDGYYTNNEKSSMRRYALNILESNMYSKEISGKMLFGEIIKSFTATMIFLLAYRYVGNYGLLLIVTQTVLSIYILQDTIMLLFYKARMDQLFNEGYTLLITNNSGDDNVALCLTYAVEYEAIKSHYKIRLSEKVFNNNKKELEIKWKQVLSH